MISIYSEPAIRYAIRCGSRFVAQAPDHSTTITLTDDPKQAHYFMTIEKARNVIDELKPRFIDPMRIVAVDLNF